MKLQPAQQFKLLWQHLGGPELEEEYRFHPSRKWRADFAHPDSMTLIEIEGGVYSGGRHTRSTGYLGDCQKYNAAQLLGWKVFRFGTGQIETEELQQIINQTGA